MNWKGLAIWMSFIFIFIIIIIVLGLFQNATAYTPHDPIHILRDDDFAAQAEIEGWPGNGTLEEPYIIEGYEITQQSPPWGFIRGIHIRLTEVHFVINNTRIIGESNSIGIFLNNVKNGTIENCIIENGSMGIYITSGNHIKIHNNTILNSDVLSEMTYNCTFSDNKLFNGGFRLLGMDLGQWRTHIIESSNTVNGRPVYFYKDQNGIAVPENAGQIILANCTNMNLENGRFENASSGIILGYSSHITISNNIIHNCNEGGVDLWYSSENLISDNEVFFCKLGIFFQHSDNNTIHFNKLYNNSEGINLVHSNSNLIYENNASSNSGWGIYCGSPSGHFINQKNTFINNTMTNNMLWGLELLNAEGFEVIGNNISYNHVGIRLRSSNEGVLHHNILFNNSIHLERQSSDTNVWQDGKSQGNFWDNYEGLDANGDGVGDTSLPHMNVDYHPLMTPYGPWGYGDSDDEDSQNASEWFITVIAVLFLLIIIFFIIIARKKKKEQD